MRVLLALLLTLGTPACVVTHQLGTGTDVPECPKGRECAFGVSWVPQPTSAVEVAPGCDGGLEGRGSGWPSDTIPGQPSTWYMVDNGVYRWCLESGIQLTCYDKDKGMYACTYVARSLEATK